VTANNIDEFKTAIENKKIILSPWGGNADDENNLKKEFNISPRCIAKTKLTNNKCFYTNKKAKHMIYFARSY
jgi:prolyl-tRNA synthetase